MCMIGMHAFCAMYMCMDMLYVCYVYNMHAIYIFMYVCTVYMYVRHVCMYAY